MNLAIFHLTLKASECVVRTAYTLYRHIETYFVVVFGNVNIFQVCQECLTVIPFDVVGFCRNIVAFCRRNRNNLDISKAEFFGKFLDLCFDLVESLFAVIHKVHFVDGKYKIFDSHQLTDSCVASCLYEHALFCVDQNDCKVGKGSSYCHVSCVFFMSRCVRNDEASFLCRKVTVRNVDRDSLLALCHQSVEKQ